MARKDRVKFQLVKKANKGNLQSIYQLYKHCINPKNEDDPDTIRKCISDMDKIVRSNSCLLGSADFKDFRKLREFSISFESDITVIVGDNGCGKTAILDGVVRSLSWLVNNIEREKVNGKTILDSDINVHCDDFSEIRAKLILDRNSIFNVSVAKPVEGLPAKKDGNYVEVKDLGSVYRLINGLEQLDLPVFANYNVTRSSTKLSAHNFETFHSDIRSNRFEAYQGFGNEQDISTEFAQKYIMLHNLSSNSETSKLQEEIENLKSLIADMYDGEEVDPEDRLVKRLELKKEELSSLYEKSFSKEYSRNLELVNDAIEKVVPSIKSLRIDRSSGFLRLIVDSFGVAVNVTQISKGQQVMLALVGDLALKMIGLNPHMENPLSASGIVFIDEIDLHLHPSWQQSVLLNLQDVFENLQFIVTTHSPQVLSTVEARCIRQVIDDGTGALVAKTPDFQTKGVTSSDILAEIMGTVSIPENVEEAQWVESFYGYLRSNDIERYSSMLLKIKEHFGEDHPIVEECESNIRISQMRLED
ncbi:retron Ec78 anti-phage system effector ATPase PtuA [Bacterioplanoides sp. SCSIO 12839]|uniref:retron Ec78 anti-phage system effector ATPase PtuA n=1 Tax=Bacterioplanoides sp. SCSIO 12839 TaxID=2829569 RepID=UPI002104E985|nr:retron Ec78 anti-phage system effector ATPase PtuA [Bacterioplanoides sp. SCSIO 12839]UTW49167.1 AAA family ATPase [Bacterioplanoides sp. SCSIO 12839]